MKKLLVIVVLIGAMAGVVKAFPGLMTFVILPVTGAEDAKKCADVGGKAAQVASLNKDGEIASGWENFCLVAVEGGNQ